MQNTLMKSNVLLGSKAFHVWFEELALPVAPSCNMMCNFCSKESDCICNGNNPDSLSKPMTPRQAVNWAVASVNKNKKIKVIRISGPGEPLFNNHTFEVLRRLNTELPEYTYSISTNGLQLDEKVEELEKLNVKEVNVSLNSIYNDTAQKLYSRIVKKNQIVAHSAEMAEILLNSQIEGIKHCVKSGIIVNINTIYFPGINHDDIYTIALKCKEWGVNSMCIISCYPNGKFQKQQIPSLAELVHLKQELSRVLQRIEIKSFIPTLST